MVAPRPIRWPEIFLDQEITVLLCSIPDVIGCTGAISIVHPET
jgi:hypothetical protein